jgi:hypothetical protein
MFVPPTKERKILIILPASTFSYNTAKQIVRRYLNSWTNRIKRNSKKTNTTDLHIKMIRMMTRSETLVWNNTWTIRTATQTATRNMKTMTKTIRTTSRAERTMTWTKRTENRIGKTEVDKLDENIMWDIRNVNFDNNTEKSRRETLNDDHRWMSKKRYTGKWGILVSFSEVHVVLNHAPLRKYSLMMDY